MRVVILAALMLPLAVQAAELRVTIKGIHSKREPHARLGQQAVEVLRTTAADIAAVTSRPVFILCACT